MADNDKDATYDPSEVEATRARSQGIGVGQRDMDRQRDPVREPPSFQSTEEFDAAPDEPASGGTGTGPRDTLKHVLAVVETL